MPDQSFGQYPALKAIDRGDGTYALADDSVVRPATAYATAYKRKSNLPFVSESLRRKAAKRRERCRSGAPSGR